MTKLPGSVPAKEVEEVKHEEHKASTDTTAHAAGVQVEEVKAEAAPAEHKHTEHKGH